MGRPPGSKNVEVPLTLTAPEVGQAAFTPSSEERLAKVENSLEKITSVLTSLVEKLPDNAPKKESASLSPMENEKLMMDLKGNVIPPKWREVLDRHFGKDFDYEFLDSAPGFALKVVLPEYLDRRIGTAKGQGRDCSVLAPLRQFSSLADLEEKCELVVKNIKVTYPLFVPKQ